MGYNANTPTVFQTGNWQCSAASSAWVLQSLGMTWGQDDVVRWLGPNHISDALGLHEGSGRMLAELFKSRGLDAHYGPLSWANALAMAGRQPFCMAGGTWYHWTGVRKSDAEGLYLANPAPNWKGVGQYMDFGEWNAWGGWNAVWVNVSTSDREEAAVIDELKETIKQLRADLAMRERRDEELISTMGYLHGDVVGALRSAHAGLKTALAAAGPVPDEVRGAVQAIEAATNTLEVHTEP
jgi:hypothetical protein